MNDATLKFLNDNRHHYDLFIRASYVKHLDAATREGLLKAAQEFSPGYNASLWCPTCVADLLKRVYTWYDKWLAEQPTQLPGIDSNEVIPVEPQYIKHL